LRATEPTADHSIPSRGDALRYEASIGLYVAAFCAGFCISGGQKSVIALATIYYPTPIRSTGIGWAEALRRTGYAKRSSDRTTILRSAIALARRPAAPYKCPSRREAQVDAVTIRTVK
jgi:hypothetical protein